MADIVDLGNDRAQEILEDALAAVVREIPVGQPGVCRWCDGPSERLVGGACARCRDERRLP